MLHRACVVPVFVYLGWRLYMEDADIAEAPINKTELSLFAVFDGHGGNT